MSKVLLVLSLFVKFFVYIILCSLIFNNDPYAQEDYLLVKDQIAGISLESQGQIHWVIDEKNTILRGIWQKWIVSATGEEINIEYCQFKNDAEAIMATSYAAIKSNAIPYTWGSYAYKIVGDGTWIVDNAGALYFVKDNIGVKIFKIAHPSKDDINIFNSMIEKIINIINSKKPKSEDLIIKGKQISDTEFNKILQPVVNIPSIMNLSTNQATESKWVTDTNNITLGARKEWTNENGFTIGIDICKFSTTEEAIKASEIKSHNTYSYERIVNFDKLNELDLILSKWQSEWKRITNNYFSVVGIKKDMVIHVYQFNQNGIDTNMFHLIFNELNKGI